MIEVVGIEDAGWASVPAREQDLVCRSRHLVGGARHLALVPEIEGQIRTPWPTPMRAQLPALFEQIGTEGVVVLASGDPLRSGVASTLIDLFGRETVRVHPSLSSETLARARMGHPGPG